MGVCHPTKTSLRSRQASLLIVALLVLASLALLSPLYIHASARTIKQSNPIPDGNGASESLSYLHSTFSWNGRRVPRFVRFTTKKCRVFSMEEVTFIVFTWYIFIIGHLIPAMLIG